MWVRPTMPFELITSITGRPLRLVFCVSAALYAYVVIVSPSTIEVRSPCHQFCEPIMNVDVVRNSDRVDVLLGGVRPKQEQARGPQGSGRPSQTPSREAFLVL